MFDVAFANISALPASVCAGDTLMVPFATFGSFLAGNRFTAMLSSSTGSFSAPMNVGYLDAAQGDTLMVVIPDATPGGTGYRLRVFASLPEDDGIPSDPFTILPQALWYNDADDDGFGDADSPVLACVAPTGSVADASDCDDAVFGASIGSPCDDMDPGTVNDTWSDQCECIGDLATGVVDRSGAPGLRAWPSPAVDHLYLSAQMNGVVQEISGRTVGIISNAWMIDVSGYAPGIYFIHTATGSILRFVKE